MAARMKSADGTSKADFLRSVARMYYIFGMNQLQIAQKLDIGRSSVARFLAEARDAGIVEIKIRGMGDAEREPELEEALRNRFKLQDAIVSVSSTNTQKSYCSVAAEYIQSILPFNGIVSIGGGETLNSISQFLKQSDQYGRLQFVQSTGILNEAVPSTAVVQAWASRLGAEPVYLSVPGIVSNPETRKLLQQDSMFVHAQQILKKADICIFGIGTTPQLLKSNQTNPAVKPYMETIQEQCVGDVCFHFYNREGDFCLPEISECVFGLSQVDFLRIPVRIAAAFGMHKIDAIYGALEGRLATVLLTDAATAGKLLEK